MEDVYNTVESSSNGLYKEKGSKFISYLFPVQQLVEIEEKLGSLKKEHPKSRHICYAYRLGSDAAQYRINDDGEPSGTAGMPIMNELLSAQVTNVLLAVVRYFGGKKLGASGLIHAYKTASQDAIGESSIIQKFVTKKVKVHFHIKDMGRLYNSLKHLNLDYGNEILLRNATIEVEIRMSKVKQLCDELAAHFHGLSIDHVRSEGFQSKIKIEEL